MDKHDEAIRNEKSCDVRKSTDHGYHLIVDPSVVCLPLRYVPLRRHRLCLAQNGPDLKWRYAQVDCGDYEVYGPAIRDGVCESGLHLSCGGRCGTVVS